MASEFREVLSFFDTLGIYDVVLPFLLVFTIVYAILEKTKVFGLEEIEDGKKVTRKNLNSMVAFVSGFFVVASTKLVAFINETIAMVVLLLILGVCFLILAGSFHSGDKEFFLEGPWRTIFMVIMFIGILLIGLNAAKTESGESWLEYGWSYMVNNWDSTAFGSVVLLLVVVGFMFFITYEQKPSKKKEES
jgi:hypothetical membrane protein